MKYTCVDYRTEMILVGLRERLKDRSLKPEEKARLEAEIKEMEIRMGLE